jgi:hypothetical protein
MSYQNQRQQIVNPDTGRLVFIDTPRGQAALRVLNDKLIEAVKAHNHRAAEHWLKMGADPNTPDWMGVPLIISIFDEGNEDRQMLDLLLRFGADINARAVRGVSAEDLGSSPIMWARSGEMHWRSPFESDALIRYMRDKGARNFGPKL